MTIFYQPETSPHKSLWTWHGTVFQILLKKHTDMYVFFVLHAVFMAMRVLGYDMLGSADADLGARLQLPGLVIVFLVVFYNQHCYERYKKFVDVAYTIIRQVLQFTQETAIYLGSENPEAVNAARYLQAAHHLVYYQLSHRMHYQIILDRGLLSEEELAVVKDYDGDEYKLPLGWAIGLCHDNLKSGDLHAMAFKSLRDKVRDSNRYTRCVAH
jgi:predicted membrane chloride channel (bestrophin family)